MKVVIHPFPRRYSDIFCNATQHLLNERMGRLLSTVARSSTTAAPPTMMPDYPGQGRHQPEPHASPERLSLHIAFFELNQTGDTQGITVGLSDDPTGLEPATSLDLHL